MGIVSALNSVSPLAGTLKGRGCAFGGSPAEIVTNSWEILLQALDVA